MGAEFVRDDDPFGTQAGFRDLVQRFARPIHQRLGGSRPPPEYSMLGPRIYPLESFGPPAPPQPFGPSPDIGTSTSIPLRSVTPLVPFLPPSWFRESLLTIPFFEAQVNPSQLHSPDVTPHSSPVPFVAQAGPY